MRISVPFELIEGVEKLLEVIKRTDSMKRYIEEVSELVTGKADNMGETLDVNQVLMELNQWKIDISRVRNLSRLRNDISYFLFDSDKEEKSDREILEKIDKLKKKGTEAAPRSNINVKEALGKVSCTRYKRIYRNWRM